MNVPLDISWNGGIKILSLVPGTHWIGGWVVLKAGPDAVGKKKILHCRESSLGHPAHSLSLYQLSYISHVESQRGKSLFQLD
jgi:hypothetical protein